MTEAVRASDSERFATDEYSIPYNTHVALSVSLTPL